MEDLIVYGVKNPKTGAYKCHRSTYYSEDTLGRYTQLYKTEKTARAAAYRGYEVVKIRLTLEELEIINE